MEEEKKTKKPKASVSRRAVIAVIAIAAVIIAFAFLIRSIVRGADNTTDLTEGSVVVEYSDENGETVTGVLNVDSTMQTTIVEYTDANGENQTNRGYILHLNDSDETIILRDTTTSQAQ